MTVTTDVVHVEEIIRDGSYVVDFQLSAADLEKLAGAVDELSTVDLVDVGAGTGFGAVTPTPALSDERHLDIVTEAVDETGLTTLLLPGVAGESEVELLSRYEEAFDLIRVGVDADNYREAGPLLESCANLDVDLSLNLLKTYLVSPETAVDAARFGADCGAETLYIVDSAGGLRPDDVREYVDQIHQKTDMTLGYHGHDNLGTGLQNTLTALDSGTTFVDTSIQGIGRSAGNVQTELLLAQLYGAEIRDDWKRLAALEGDLRDIYPGAGDKSVVDVLYGLAKFHSGQTDDLRAFAAEIGRSELDVLLDAAQRELGSIEEITADLDGQKR